MPPARPYHNLSPLPCVLFPIPCSPFRCEYITVRYQTAMLHNGTCYKTVRVSKWYVFQNGNFTTRYVLQTGTCYKPVRVTKRYVTKRYMLQNGTFLIL
jgi:hypothetical protein